MRPVASRQARFVREWNCAFGLVAIVAAVLFTAGHVIAGSIASGLCVAAYLARWSAMRSQGRGFYGHEKQPR